MKKLLVVGCSFAKGMGLLYEDKNESLWVNQLHKHCWPDYKLTNLSKIGSNNDWIFLETLSALIKETYDLVLVEWTAIPRFNFNIGLELYSTHTMFTDIDININNESISGKWLLQMGNNLKRYHNDHWDILTLIKYINTLIEIQTSRNSSILFVNGLAPWPTNYFIKKKFTVPSDLSIFEKKMFNVDTRDDNEIFKLYDKVHSEYELYGGIHHDCWLNLYDSLLSLQIDDASNTDQHPGLLSQDIFVNKLKENICTS
jgi:hypothetical protein